VSGRGRFLGVNVGINANPAYKGTWWGEGEVKIFLNADGAHPTFAGTGSEDYIGTGWGEGEFFNDFSGCLVADEKNLQWAFYRFQIPDPVFFDSACRVTLQQIGGGPKATLAALQHAGVPLIPVSIDHEGDLSKLYQEGTVDRADDPKLPEGWMNFYRSDDVSATAYFYLSTPSDGLPPLQPAPERTEAPKAIAPRCRVPVLLGPERDHRIHLCGAARGQEAGGACDRRDDRRDAGKCRRIVCAHAVELREAMNRMRKSERTRPTPSPIAPSRSPSASTSRSTSTFWAPRAILTPNSRVRCATA
jgi:hypothetical protein